MPPSIRNLRRGVVFGGAVLLAVVAGFLGYAKLRGIHFHLDLPGHLGVDISQTASGFTYSQSQKGHTLFTIHASKLVEYKGNQAELHDVTITLYGPEGSGRVDRIYGSDFKYDRKQGVARAEGLVRIDFSAPQSKPGSKPGSAPAQPGATAIHVTTSGLVFNQQTGAATTDQRVDFVLSRASGSAVGADYNARQGVLVLGSEVVLATTADPVTGRGAPTVIHAEHAQLFREAHQAYLIKAEATTGGRRTTADQATINFRGDGSAEQIEAEGHVRLVTEESAEVHASSAVIALDLQSHPAAAKLGGGVTFYQNNGAQTLQGSANTGTLSFVSAPAAAGGGAKGLQQQLKHAQFRDAVSFVAQQQTLPGDPHGSATREMRASQVDVDFSPGANGKAEAQRALGTGGAAVTLHDVPSKGPGTATMVAADQLLATLDHGRALKTLDGKGNAKIVDGSAPEPSSISTGDTLHVTFAASSAPPARSAGGPGPRAAGGAGGAQVDTATLAGDVTLLQVPAADARDDSGHPQAPLHATAQHAEYHAGDRVLHLTGDPHLRNDTLAVTADKLDYHRDSGDAAALGNVKATYVQQPGPQQAPTLGGSGPVHVTADHAQLTRATNVSFFYGTSAAPARMWQGGDAVMAPVLELLKNEGALDAHGASGEHAPVVHAMLGAKGEAEAAPGAASSPAASQPAGTGKAAEGVPTRLTCVTLHYSDQDRRADLRGSVTAEQPTGVLHADQAQVYLTPSGPGKSSRLDHMVAAGHVVLTQPGRRGTGAKLVYVAADARYTLTGTAADPPRITDADKGTTTGTALIFRSGDDSVQVSSRADPVPGSAAPAPSKRTVTDTHTPN